MTGINRPNKIIRDVDEFIKTENYEEAKFLLEELLFEEPGCGIAHGYLAWLYLNCFSNKERAKIHFEYSLKFDPGFIGAYINYALLLIAEREFSKAMQLLNKALALKDVDTILIHELTGNIYELRREFRRAQRAYMSALNQTVDTWRGDELVGHIKRVRRKRWMNLFN